MFGSKQRGTVIAKGLKIVGSVTAEGLVEVNGQIDDELHCISLVIARGAHVNGIVAAERVVVDGKVEGPIQGGEVVLKSHAHVVGDIHHQSLAIDSGAFFDGHSVHISCIVSARRANVLQRIGFLDKVSLLRIRKKPRNRTNRGF